jgi:1,4-alpha-glucan branching enzyme
MLSETVAHEAREKNDRLNMPVLTPRLRPPARLSPARTIKPVNFICAVTAARHVTLIGDFNDWHPHATPMKRQPDGCWHAQLPLRAGHHHYLFLVDGKPMLDPRAQGVARNERDEKVSLLSVGH